MEVLWVAGLFMAVTGIGSRVNVVDAQPSAPSAAEGGSYRVVYRVFFSSSSVTEFSLIFVRVFFQCFNAVRVGFSLCLLFRVALLCCEVLSFFFSLANRSKARGSNKNPNSGQNKKPEITTKKRFDRHLFEPEANPRQQPEISGLVEAAR